MGSRNLKIFPIKTHASGHHFVEERANATGVLIKHHPFPPRFKPHLQEIVHKHAYLLLHILLQ